MFFLSINNPKPESEMDSKLEKLNALKSKLHKRKNNNVLPGQTFRLPSLGMGYEPGVLSEDVVKGEIVLHPMNTLDEICLKTPDMLFQGTAVEQVIHRRAPQILRPLDLIPKDVDYILSALRQITYGDILDINFTCSSDTCNHKNMKATAKISNFLRKAKTLENFDNTTLFFEVDGFNFESKFSTYGDMVRLNQKNVNNTMDTADEVYQVFVDNLAVSIAAIDGEDDPEIIHHFLFDEADAIFQQKILDHIQEINQWGVEFKQDFACEKCGHTTTIPIAINPVSFFSPPSDQEI